MEMTSEPGQGEGWDKGIILQHKELIVAELNISKKTRTHVLACVLPQSLLCI